MRLLTVLETPHTEKCHEYLDMTSWPHAWWLTPETVYRDCNGQRRGRNHRWLVLGCNLGSIVGCTATLLVHDRILTDAIIEEAGVL